MEHIYDCEIWNKTKSEKNQFNNIYNGNIKKQMKILKIFKYNLGQRNRRIKTDNSHVILIESSVSPIIYGLAVMGIQINKSQICAKHSCCYFMLSFR